MASDLGVALSDKPEKFDIRRNDRLPPYRVDVLDRSDGSPLALSGTAVFTLKDQDGTLKIDRQPASIVVGEDGSTLNRLEYAWGATDTDTAGRYTAEFEVTTGGLKRTFPASDKQALVVTIHADRDAN